jgi:acyl carrier protein
MHEFQELMTGVLMCEPEDLPEGSIALRNIEGWDSLKHVLLIVALEKELDKKLTAAEIQGIVTGDDVARLLRQKGVNV